MMVNYVDIILSIRPVASVALVGEDIYENIQWGDETPIPKAELDAHREVVVSERAAATQKRQINAERDKQLSDGFTHDGTLWHCDAGFQSQVQGFILAYSTGMLSPAATVIIRSKDNTNHNLTQEQIIVLAGALMAHVQGIYAASWAAKDAL